MENSNNQDVTDHEHNTENQGNVTDQYHEEDKAIQLMIYYDMYEEGHFCDCKEYGIWDRIYDDNDKFAGYKLQHIHQCIGRVKLSELIREVKSGQG